MRPSEWMGRWLTRTHHSLHMPGLTVTVKGVAHDRGF